MLIIGALHHVSLIVRDLAASKHFYCDVLGMNDVPRPTNFEFAGAWFRAGAAEIHVIQLNDAVQEPGDAPRYPTEHRDASFARHFCFQITNVDEMLTALHANEVPILVGPRPRGDGAIQTYVIDPDGHLVELIYASTGPSKVS